MIARKSRKIVEKWTKEVIQATQIKCHVIYWLEIEGYIQECHEDLPS